MLYKFKSDTEADLIMLEPLARQVLQTLGKDNPKGIILAAEMPQAIASLVALTQSLERHEHAPAQPEQAEDENQAASLRARLWPFVNLLERCHKTQVPVTWGV